MFRNLHEIIRLKGALKNKIIRSKSRHVRNFAARRSGRRALGVHMVDIPRTKFFA